MPKGSKTNKSFPACRAIATDLSRRLRSKLTPRNITCSPVRTYPKGRMPSAQLERLSGINLPGRAKSRPGRKWSMITCVGV